MKKISLFSHIVLQPTTLCNLNCRYCYLPDRDRVDVMSREVTEAIAKSIAEINQPVCLVWHGGEPLAARIKTFGEIIEPFRELFSRKLVRHNIQTNGSLITQHWCDFFKEWQFQIGVSLDGDELQNSERVTITGTPSFRKVMGGIELLIQNDLSYSVLATVNPKNIQDPQSFYNFFVSLGCSSLNINIEEKEGFNQNSIGLDSGDVQYFWKKLFEAWTKNPVIRIREIDMVLGYMSSVLSTQKAANYKKHYGRGYWPTVAFNGDVVVLSPEFISVDVAERGKFVVGNVLMKSLYDLVEESKRAWYVREFFEGAVQCKNSCDYYEFCGGGQASNKYFELGNIAGTETAQFRNSRIAVMDAVLESLTQYEKSIKVERR